MGASIRNILIGAMVLGATACLVLGLTVPVVRLSYLYFWTQDYSLSAIVRQLYRDNELFLAAVIFVFSIVFPAFKLLYLLTAFAAAPTMYLPLKPSAARSASSTRPFRKPSSTTSPKTTSPICTLRQSRMDSFRLPYLAPRPTWEPLSCPRTSRTWSR